MYHLKVCVKIPQVYGRGWDTFIMLSLRHLAVESIPEDTKISEVQKLAISYIGLEIAREKGKLFKQIDTLRREDNKLIDEYNECTDEGINDSDDIIEKRRAIREMYWEIFHLKKDYEEEHGISGPNYPYIDYIFKMCMQDTDHCILPSNIRTILTGILENKKNYFIEIHPIGEYEIEIWQRIIIYFQLCQTLLDHINLRFFQENLPNLVRLKNESYAILSQKKRLEEHYHRLDTIRRKVDRLRKHYVPAVLLPPDEGGAFLDLDNMDFQYDP